MQFLVVDIFDLLEEQLAEAEELDAHFPRGGARARVVTSEGVLEGYFPPNRPPPMQVGPPYTPNPPGLVADPPRVVSRDNGRVEPQVCPPPFSVSDVVNLGMDIGNALTQP